MTEEEEQSPGLARAQARRRVQQSGGESRLLRDVKLHFKLRDWEGVVPLLEQLIEISPGKGEYRGMLARALSLHPSRGKEAEEHFVEALRLSPRDAQIHYWLGLYYKSFGLGSRAENEFRTTLRIDPKHEGARRQLGATDASDDALGSVIKKLFG
jgi:tetratricopeptide (TPR) repeat protein